MILDDCCFHYGSTWKCLLTKCLCGARGNRSIVIPIIIPHCSQDAEGCKSPHCPPCCHLQPLLGFCAFTSAVRSAPTPSLTPAASHLRHRQPSSLLYHPLQPPWATDSRVAHRKWKLSGGMTSRVDVFTAHTCTNHAIKPTSLCSNSPRCKRYSHRLFSRSPPFSEPCSRNYPFYACIFSLYLAIDFF